MIILWYIESNNEIITIICIWSNIEFSYDSKDTKKKVDHRIRIDNYIVIVV